jgi:hypothetical protein
MEPIMTTKEPAAIPSLTWRTADISWACSYLTEATSYDGALIQREWDAMKAIALAAEAAAPLQVSGASAESCLWRLAEGGGHEIRFNAPLESDKRTWIAYSVATPAAPVAAPDEQKRPDLASAIKALPSMCWWHADGHPVFNNMNGDDLVLRKDVEALLAPLSPDQPTGEKK